MGTNKFKKKSLYILEVFIVNGDKLKHGWKKQMQVVLTTKGVFISAIENAPDWTDFINGKKYNVEVSEGSGHLWIAKPRLSFLGGSNG